MPDRNAPAAERPDPPDPPDRAEQPTRDDRTPEERAEQARRERLANRTTWEAGTAPSDRGAPRPAPGGELDRGGGRYVVHEEIARGGMGRVVAATDLILGRVVAVKEALTTDPDTVRRFARETEITARLEHPAIVPVYDAGFDETGMPYYVMRKVSGQPLERLVESTRTLAERLSLLPHVVAAAQAVAHAHRNGVLHRDLKPSNILVGELGETVVIDWGLAKVTGEVDAARVDPLPSSGNHVLTHAGAVFGTPGFMSPEQIAGEPVDARGDVYALGATLYFLLAKRAPHHAESGKAMMALAAAGPPAPIAELVPGVPRDLAWIIQTALAFDPADRHPHAGALAAELEDFLTGQLVASRHYTRREHLVRFVRRHRIVVITVVAALIGLGIAASRVLAERARAARALATALHEKRQADEANVEMTLNHARALLHSNPTAAVAQARPLADGPRWRDVRGIAAAARYSGACWGLPGPLRPSVVTIAPGGRAATSSDQDGTVWFHDLDRRTSRELIRLGVSHGHAAFAGDDRIVIYSTQRLAVIELATGAIRDLPHGVEIRSAAAARSAVFVVTEAGHLHRFELDGSGSVRLDVEGAHGVALSPDERRLAAETAAGVVVFDLAGGAPPVRIGDRPVLDVQWDASSTAFSVHFLDHELALVALEPAPQVVARRPGTRRGGAHVALGGRLITHTEHGLEGAGAGRLVDGARTRDFPLSVARGDTLVVGRHVGTITLLHDLVGVELRAPSDRLDRLATSPASPYVVAAAQGRLLVWNLDDILPRVRRIERAHEHYAVSPRRLLLGTAAGDWRWHDVDTGVEVPVQIPVKPFWPVFDGREDLVVLTYDRRAAAGTVPGFAVVKYGQPVIEVETEVSAVRVADGQITVGTPDGEVLDFDPVRSESRALTERPGRAVTAVGANGRWRSARWSDGVLWRRGPDGREELATPFAGPAPLSLLIQQASGRVCVGVQARLECWNPDGSSTLVATFPADVVGIDLTGDDVAIVALADRGLYRVELRKPGDPTSLGASGGMPPILASAAGLGVWLGADNRVSVVDLVVNASWPIINGVRGVNQGVRITPDGDHVSVLASSEYLLGWRLRLPQGPEATARWLDEMTNATIEHGTTKLSWRR